MGEMGIPPTPGEAMPFMLELSVQGYVGKRKGATGSSSSSTPSSTPGRTHIRARSVPLGQASLGQAGRVLCFRPVRCLSGARFAGSLLDRAASPKKAVAVHVCVSYVKGVNQPHPPHPTNN